MQSEKFIIRSSLEKEKSPEWRVYNINAEREIEPSWSCIFQFHAVKRVAVAGED